MIGLAWAGPVILAGVAIWAVYMFGRVASVSYQTWMKVPADSASNSQMLAGLVVGAGGALGITVYVLRTLGLLP